MKRKNFLRFCFVAIIGGIILWWKRNPITRGILSSGNNDDLGIISAPSFTTVDCILTPEQNQGPYFVKSQLRSNIKEDRKGIPFTINFKVVNLPNCTPVENALIEIWHCDAQGRYSGYNETVSRKPFDAIAEMLLAGGGGESMPTINKKTYLRGGQVSDSEGNVVFETIFPGWYEPRITHIHAKVSLNGKSFLTTQLYFPDELLNKIYTEHPDYSPFGTCPYSLHNDMVLRGKPDANGLLLVPSETDEGLSVDLKLGIDDSGNLE